MPHTFVMNVKNHQYLYEAESYRNEEGQPRSKKQIVGKVDPLTGQCEYKQWYIDKMRDAGKSLPLPEKTVFEFTSDDLRHSQIKEIGASYLIYKISDKIGLSSILKEVFPRMWREVLTLAAYLACTNDALMYCQDWASSTETLDTVGLSSQHITEILDT